MDENRWNAQTAVLLVAAFCVLSATAAPTQKNTWTRLGCHMAGHQRKVQIPDCYAFVASTNACRGYCYSRTEPMNDFVFPQADEAEWAITSRGSCCGVEEVEDVYYSVPCWEAGVIVRRNITFKSATRCRCTDCSYDATRTTYDVGYQHEPSAG